MSSTIDIRRLTDKQIVLKMIQACVKADFTCTAVVIHSPMIGAHTVNISVDGEFSGSKESLTLLELDAVIATNFNFTVSARSISLESPIAIRRNFTTSFDLIDFAKLSETQVKAPDASLKKLLLLSKIKEVYPVTERTSFPAELLSDEQKRYFDAKDEILGRLEQAHQQIVFQQDKWRKELELSFTVRRNELDEEFKNKVLALNQDREALEARVKLVDDRSRIHARRDTRKDLKDQFKSRLQKFSLSESTNAKRRPITILLVSMLSIFGALFTWSIVSTIVSGTIDSPTAIRQVLLALAFGAPSVYFLKWHNNWLREHAEEEFSLMRLDLDIDRASWLVELYAETSGESKSLPDTVVERLASGLFERKDVMKTEHPLESASSILLGAAGRMKVAFPNGEIELDKRGIKSLSN